jgi:hypothetical protein
MIRRSVRMANRQPPRSLPILETDSLRRCRGCSSARSERFRFSISAAVLRSAGSLDGSLKTVPSKARRCLHSGRGKICQYWCWFSASCRANASSIVPMNRCPQCSAFLWNGLPQPNIWENIPAGNSCKGDARNQESNLLSCPKNGQGMRCAYRSGTDWAAISSVATWLVQRTCARMKWWLRQFLDLGDTGGWPGPPHSRKGAAGQRGTFLPRRTPSALTGQCQVHSSISAN